MRHFYASLLIRHGESVKTVQACLGHASAVETLNTYGHMWPDADDRTRDAVTEVLANLARPHAASKRPNRTSALVNASLGQNAGI